MTKELKDENVFINKKTGEEFEAIPVYHRPSEEAYYLQKTKEQWQPEAYEDGWFVSSLNGVDKFITLDAGKKLTESGNLYPSKDQAEQAATRRISIERYNQKAMEENKRTDFEPDWENDWQSKFFVEYYIDNDIWDVACVLWQTMPWLVYVNEESARRMADMLNSGELSLEVE